MDLRRLEYFAAVVDHGGFSRAAAAVHVAQPSLSQGIARLEQELGVELFLRAGRGVRLTATGEELLAQVRRILRDTQVLTDSARAIAGVEGGRLDVASLPTLAADPMARLVGVFRAAHPRVRVALYAPESRRALAALVRLGSVELAVADLPLDSADGDLVTEELADHELVVVFPPGSGVAPGARVPIAELGAEALVVTPPGTSTRAVVDRAWTNAGLVPDIAVETGARESLLPLALAGAGVAVVPRDSARDAPTRGGIVRGVDPPLVRTIGLVRRAGPWSPAADVFATLARDWAAGLDDRS